MNNVIEPKNLSWSRFNFLIECEDKEFYLYNTYSNTLVKLNDALYGILRSFESSIILTGADLALLSTSELDYFREAYILTESDDDLVEILHMHSMSRINSMKSLVLTIAPTQSCNFACTYCFEKWRKSKPMDDATEDAIIRYIMKMQEEHSLEYISLSWYGGEPLLQTERVVSLAGRIRNLGLTITENLLITNGYYLTCDTANKLLKAGINQIQITLDGLKHTHDERRPLVNGEGTFDRIIQNLDRLYTSGLMSHFYIAIRVNIDNRNYSEFVVIYKWLKNKYPVNNLMIYPGIVVLDEDDTNASACLRRNNVTDIFLELYKQYGIISEELYPDNINMECMTRSPYNNMLIGSRGEIYKCYEDLGNKQLVVGNINNPEIWDNYTLMARYATGIDHYNDPQCRKCSYLPICRGGCPIRRYENVYEGKNNDCCTPFKGRMKDYIALYQDIKTKR